MLHRIIEQLDRIENMGKLYLEKLTINNQLGIIMGDYKLLKQNQIIKEMIG